MNLTIDIGNTRVKLVVFNGKELIESDVVLHNEIIKLLHSYAIKYPSIKKSIISNVGAEINGLSDYLKKTYEHLNLDTKTNLPIKINYKTPETLGVDRKALSVAAYKINKGNNSLIIDMGTCITYDVVTSKGIYEGGAISPGLDMRFKAMHNFTEQLPLVNFTETDSIIGKDTKSSMINGVRLGIYSEIDAYIDALKMEYKKLSVFITGGDSQFFVDKLKNTIFADRFFLHRGLNMIIDYNFK